MSLCGMHLIGIFVLFTLIYHMIFISLQCTPMDALPPLVLLRVLRCLAAELGQEALRSVAVARIGQASTLQRDIVALACGLTEVDPGVLRNCTQT